MSLPKTGALCALLFCLASAQTYGQSTEMPMMVHSDAKRFGSDANIEGCGLMITANSINGEYISVVLRLHDENTHSAVEYTVASGHIDYTNGNETYDYVEGAWLEAGDMSTQNNVTDVGRGPSDYSYRATYRKNALSFYESILQAPFDLTLVTTMHSQPYTKTFEQPFDQFVVKQAKGCLEGYKAQR